MSVGSVVLAGVPGPVVESRSPGAERWMLRRVACLLVLLSVLVGWHRWTLTEAEYRHPDEPIAEGVIGRIVDEETFDTNWARAEVPEVFRYNQYNFSSYYLFAAAIEHWRGGDSQERIVRARQLSAVLGGICVFFAGLLGLRWRGSVCAVTAALLTAAAISLLQDSIYARPETFATCLSLIWLCMMTSSQAARPIAQFGAGFVIGLLIACKISFLPLLPVTWACARLRDPGSPLESTPAWVGPLLLLVASGIGIAVGAPFALLAPDEYREGIAYLFNQYGSGHWPHGLPYAGFLQRLWFGLRYLWTALGGAVLIAAIYGGWVLQRERRWRTLAACAGLLLMLIYFLQTKVFFERNFSHALPALFLLAGVGVAEAWRRLPHALLGAALLVIVTAPSWVLAARFQQALSDTTQVDEAQRVEDQLAADATERITSPGTYLVQQMSKEICARRVFRVLHYSDAVTAQVLAEFDARSRYELAARLPGAFSDLPTSTLHTYHSADIVFLIEQPDRTCPVSIVPWADYRDWQPVEVDVALTGAAQKDGQHPGAERNDWRGDLYASWSGNDSNTGTIEMTINGACGDLAIPFVRGPSDEGLALRVSSAGKRIFAESPLRIRTADGWAVMHLRRPLNDCRPITARAVDTGDSWGAWVGLGQPVAGTRP